jgi:hypothetical protein
VSRQGNSAVRGRSDGLGDSGGRRCRGASLVPLGRRDRNLVREPGALVADALEHAMMHDGVVHVA